MLSEISRCLCGVQYYDERNGLGGSKLRNNRKLIKDNITLLGRKKMYTDTGKLCLFALCDEDDSQDSTAHRCARRSRIAVRPDLRHN